MALAASLLSQHPHSCAWRWYMHSGSTRPGMNRTKEGNGSPVDIPCRCRPLHALHSISNKPKPETCRIAANEDPKQRQMRRERHTMHEIALHTATSGGNIGFVLCRPMAFACRTKHVLHMLHCCLEHLDVGHHAESSIFPFGLQDMDNAAPEIEGEQEKDTRETRPWPSSFGSRYW